MAQAKLKLVNDESARDLAGRAQFRQKRTPDKHGWRNAMEDFLLEKKGNCEEKTLQFYRERLQIATDWMIEHGRGGEGVPIEEFKARDMREYLAFRADVLNERTGEVIKDNTRRQDAIALRALIRFCVKERLIERNPLLEYSLPRRTRAHVTIPTEEHIRQLLRACQDRWLVRKNPDARFLSPRARTFFARRQFAVLCTLVDTGLRISEVLDLKIENYDKERLAIAVAEAKGNQPRTIPISPYACDAIDAYLRARPKCKSDRLFINEYGERINYWVIRHCMRRDAQFAGIPDLSFHKLRHYAATCLAKSDVWAASQILGHSTISVTMTYLHGDPAHVRAAHTAAGPLAGIMENKRASNGASLPVDAVPRKRLI